MRNNRKLRSRASRRAAITVSRSALGHDKLVYIGSVNKKIPYAWAKSKIVYIGTTEVGPTRIATSAARRAKEVLKDHGLKVLEFYPVIPEGRQNIKSWRALEGDLLFEFRRTFGELPRCNKRLESTQLPRRFSERRLRSIIQKYS